MSVGWYGASVRGKLGGINRRRFYRIMVGPQSFPRQIHRRRRSRRNDLI
jgi:hypothetical protein